MYEKIIERNKIHFSQADGTPFTVSPLTDILGRYGTNQNADEILAGTYPLETIELPKKGKEAVMKILEKLGENCSKDGVDNYLTVEDYKNGYNRWRETTSTSPSGLHLGHEKALFKMEKESEEEDKLSTRIFATKVKFMNFAIKHRHVYK
jgi:hypothetical protein